MAKNNNINLNNSEHNFKINLYSKKENSSIIKYINIFKIKVEEFSESFSLFLKSSVVINTISHMLIQLKAKSISSNKINMRIGFKSIKKMHMITNSFINTKFNLRMIKKITMISSTKISIGKNRILSSLDNLLLGNIDNQTLGQLDYGESLILLMTKRLLPNKSKSCFVTTANFNLYRLALLSDYDSHILSYMDSKTLGELDKIII